MELLEKYIKDNLNDNVGGNDDLKRFIPDSEIKKLIEDIKNDDNLGELFDEAIYKHVKEYVEIKKQYNVRLTITFKDDDLYDDIYLGDIFDDNYDIYDDMSVYRFVENNLEAIKKRVKEYIDNLDDIKGKDIGRVYVGLEQTRYFEDEDEFVGTEINTWELGNYEE